MIMVLLNIIRTNR